MAPGAWVGQLVRLQVELWVSGGMQLWVLWVLCGRCAKLKRVSTLPSHFWDFCARFRFRLAVGKAGHCFWQQFQNVEASRIRSWLRLNQRNPAWLGVCKNRCDCPRLCPYSCPQFWLSLSQFLSLPWLSRSLPRLFRSRSRVPPVRVPIPVPIPALPVAVPIPAVPAGRREDTLPLEAARDRGKGMLGASPFLERGNPPRGGRWGRGTCGTCPWVTPGTSSRCPARDGHTWGR